MAAQFQITTRQVRFACERCEHEFTAAYTARADQPLTYLYDGCPACRGEALAVSCLACGMESPEEGTDLCMGCTVSNYLNGIESFEIDRVQNARFSWWPEIERAVLNAYTERRLQSRYSHQRAIA